MRAASYAWIAKRESCLGVEGQMTGQSNSFRLRADVEPRATIEDEQPK